MPFTLKQKHYAILNFANVNVDPYARSNEQYRKQLVEMLQKGLYFFNNTLKYWVDENGSDCFNLYARYLSITGSDDPSCWKWYRDTEEPVEVAESDNVRWLEAKVRFSSVNLTHNTTYRFSFMVKVKSQEMKNVPLNVQLTLPNGSKQENQKNVTEVDKWQSVEVGTFRTEYNNVGVLDISLQHLGSIWKKGIAIKCVEIVAMN